MDYPNTSQQSGGYKAPNITTNGIALFDNNGTMLRFGLLDDTFSLSIQAPGIGENGKRTYPKEGRTSLIITPERATALYKILIDEAIPALEAGSSMNKGIFYTKAKTSILEWVVVNRRCSLVFHNSINPERICTTSLVFNFEKTATIEGYRNDGSGEPVIKEEDALLLLFSLMLRGVVMNSISGAAGHSAKVALNYQMKAMSKNLYAIAEKVGASIQTNTNGYSREEGLPFGTPINPIGTTDTMPAAQESSLEALLGM